MSLSAFSAGELLKPALLNVRQHAAWINVVYQTVSHRGISAPEYLQDLLSDLQREGLADRWLLFQPPFKAATPEGYQIFHRAKREMGREDCRQAGCTHVMLRDCDEFYFPDQFRWAMGEAARFDVTYVSSVDYVRLPIIRRPALSGPSLPLIHRAELPLGKAGLPFQVDPARTVVGAQSQKRLSPYRIVMHHMNRVRFDQEELARKYENHSWSYAKADVLRKRVEEWKDLDFRHYLWLEKDSFGILEYWEKEFRKYKQWEGELPAFKVNEFEPSLPWR